MYRESEVKKAFRTAYDMLEKFGKPEYKSEWYEAVAASLAQEVAKADTNPLLPHLLRAVYEYLVTIGRMEANK